MSVSGQGRVVQMLLNCLLSYVKSWRVPCLVSFKRWSRLHGTSHLPGYIVAILLRGECNFANHSLKVKIKVKFTLVQAMKT